MMPTDEQGHVLNLLDAGGNIMINSLAGTGKTTMLRMIDAEINAEHPVLYLAFNRRVVEEALEPDDEGNPKFNTTTDITTINGQGHRILQKHTKAKLVVNTRKSRELLAQYINAIKNKDDRDALWSESNTIVQAVAFAKALGYVPKGARGVGLINRDEFFLRFEHEEEEISEVARHYVDAVLLDSIKTAWAGNIDFNDQVYMSALFCSSFPRYPYVMGDEVQDWSPINHALLLQITKPTLRAPTGSRFIAAGDPWQSIYAFRGAYVGGMAALQAKKQMTPADLSVSFRCPEEVVRHVHWHVPKLKWHKTGGHVETLHKLSSSEIADDSAIICRNNAPLLRLAFHLLAQKRSVSLAGSDVGPRVIAIMEELGDTHMPQDFLIGAIEEWRSEKLEKGSTTADDVADCMRVFSSYGTTLGQAVDYAKHLFKQQGKLTLITGHKAKGLEWDTVYHLDPWIIKSGEQEDNLKYVISTRSKQSLYEIDSKEIK
jgi:superfamily I DNA/RNA helicase